VDGIWATKSEAAGLLAVLLVSEISNICDPDPPTLQTHRQADRQSADGRTDDMRSQYRALHYSASRGKNQAIFDEDIDKSIVIFQYGLRSTFWPTLALL